MSESPKWKYPVNLEGKISRRRDSDRRILLSVYTGTLATFPNPVWSGKCDGRMEYASIFTILLFDMFSRKNPFLIE